MKRVQLFLLADGALVGIMAAILFLFFWKRNKGTNFKDEIWNQKNPEIPEVAKRVDAAVLLQIGSNPKEPSFATPNFGGTAHEILGIEATATPERIKAAHRYWIARYHPDKVVSLGNDYVRQALRRAEQLNRARETLLKGVRR